MSGLFFISIFWSANLFGKRRVERHRRRAGGTKAFILFFYQATGPTEMVKKKACPFSFFFWYSLQKNTMNSFFSPKFRYLLIWRKIRLGLAYDYSLDASNLGKYLHLHYSTQLTWSFFSLSPDRRQGGRIIGYHSYCPMFRRRYTDSPPLAASLMSVTRSELRRKALTKKSLLVYRGSYVEARLLCI